MQDKQGDVDVEIRVTTDKRKATDLERTASPVRARARTVSKMSVELSRECKEAPWWFHPMDGGGDRALGAAPKLTAGETPEKATVGAVKHGASLFARAATWIEKQGKIRESFAMMIGGQNKWRLDQITYEGVEPCARSWCWMDGPGYTAAATVLERRILFQKGQHFVMTLFLKDQHLTTVIQFADEWAEPIEKMLEKQADMRAAGVRVRSEGSTSSLFTGALATNRGRPLSRKSHTLSAATSRKLTIARGNDPTHGHAGAKGDRGLNTQTPEGAAGVELPVV